MHDGNQVEDDPRFSYIARSSYRARRKYVIARRRYSSVAGSSYIAKSGVVLDLGMEDG